MADGAAALPAAAAAAAPRPEPEGEGGGGGGGGGALRLFVGGVPPDVTSAELERRFAAFGAVLGVDVVPAKRSAAGASGEAPSAAAAAATAAAECRGFAYVELVPQSDAALRKCFSAAKSIPLTGLGKHKRSFQNVDVPPLQQTLEEACRVAGAAAARDQRPWPQVRGISLPEATGAPNPPATVTNSRPLEVLSSARSMEADGVTLANHGAASPSAKSMKLKRRIAAADRASGLRQSAAGLDDDAHLDVAPITERQPMLEPAKDGHPAALSLSEDDVARGLIEERRLLLRVLAAMYPEDGSSGAQGTGAQEAAAPLKAFSATLRYDPTQGSLDQRKSVLHEGKLLPTAKTDGKTADMAEGHEPISGSEKDDGQELQLEREIMDPWERLFAKAALRPGQVSGSGYKEDRTDGGWSFAATGGTSSEEVAEESDEVTRAVDHNESEAQTPEREKGGQAGRGISSLQSTEDAAVELELRSLADTQSAAQRDQASQKQPVDSLPTHQLNENENPVNGNGVPEGLASSVKRKKVKKKDRLSAVIQAKTADASNKGIEVSVPSVTLLAESKDSDKPLAPKDGQEKWYQRATWKSLVDHDGTASFSLTSVLPISALTKAGAATEPVNGAKDGKTRSAITAKRQSPMEVKLCEAEALLDGSNAGIGNTNRRLRTTEAESAHEQQGHKPPADTLQGTKRSNSCAVAQRPDEKVEPDGLVTSGSSFMRSSNAEAEWLALKQAIKGDYKKKHKAALRKGPISIKGGLGQFDLVP
eukprot:SM000113S24049  [mRNA]  locus=s113:183202:186791:- [translate_table: standard]